MTTRKKKLNRREETGKTRAFEIKLFEKIKAVMGIANDEITPRYKCRRFKVAQTKINWITDRLQIKKSLSVLTSAIYLYYVFRNKTTQTKPPRSSNR